MSFFGWASSRRFAECVAFAIALSCGLTRSIAGPPVPAHAAFYLSNTQSPLETVASFVDMMSACYRAHSKNCGDASADTRENILYQLELVHTVSIFDLNYKKYSQSVHNDFRDVGSKVIGTWNEFSTQLFNADVEFLARFGAT